MSFNFQSVIFFSFFTIGMSDVSKKRGKKKKKEEDTAWTPESSELYQFWCPTHVGHQHVAKIGMSVQPRAQYPCSILIYLNRS